MKKQETGEADPLKRIVEKAFTPRVNPQIHICGLCHKPNVVEWSGKWTKTERLFLICLLARIARAERGGGFKRDKGWRRAHEWREATPDYDWLITITSGAPQQITVADLVVETVLEIDPTTDFEVVLRALEERLSKCEE